MARIEDLVSEIKDSILRKEVRRALTEAKRQLRFGLVYEDHSPEVAVLYGLPIKVGSVVQLRSEANGSPSYRVMSLSRSQRIATITPIDGGAGKDVPVGNLLSVKRFDEPMYSLLTPLKSIKRGGDKPFHAVINGENYHALQLLTYMFEGQVDCIYIDPPYNTGARDWKYNNHFVDANDAWRHSKWLSFMEKRLALAKRLLKEDGVLIVTIDEHEVHHLGMLLERLYPEYLRYMVTIVNNPKGTGKANFSRVEEYAFFVVPDLGTDVVKARPIEASLDTMITGVDTPDSEIEGEEEETEDEEDEGDEEDEEEDAGDENSSA